MANVTKSGDRRFTISLRGVGDSFVFQKGGNDKVTFILEPIAGTTITTSLSGSSVALRTDAAGAVFWSKADNIKFTIDVGSATIYADTENA